MAETIDPAALAAVTFYSTGCYDRFDEMGFEAAREAATFCSEWSLEYPLHLRDRKGNFPERDIPGFGLKSSVYAIAVQAAFLVWTQKGQATPESPLLGAAKMGWLLRGPKP